MRVDASKEDEGWVVIVGRFRHVECTGDHVDDGERADYGEKLATPSF